LRSLRIVIVMVEPPLPFGNAAARHFYVLLKGLAARGARVTVFATCGEPAQMEQVRSVFPAPYYDLRCYARTARRGRLPKWETLLKPHSFLFSPKMRRDLEDELTKGFDVLHLEQLWSGWLGLSHAAKTLLNVHYLPSIDLIGFSESMRERAYRRLAIRGERKLLHSFPRISALSPRLAESVRRQNPAANVYTIPLGIDLALYEFAASAQPHAPLIVSLIGSFDWLPTLWAGRRILERLWPAIRAACPGAALRFVGRDVGLALRESRGKDIRGFSVAENVTDILPHFRASDVLLYPAHQASGMKVKVLEAFALGVPVVTTAEGVEGLPAEDGVHAGIADDDTGLIKRTIALLRDRAARERMRAAARQLVETHCRPTRILNDLEAIYSEIRGANLRATLSVGAVPPYGRRYTRFRTLH
jgi:polysaccharide biosynthesis protein PslH